MNNIMQTDSVMSDLPKCTICEQPATSIIRNYSREEIEGGRYKFKPIGEPEWRCKNHDEPTMYNVGSLYDIAVFKSIISESEIIIENEETV